MGLLANLAKSALFQLDAETAHAAAITALKTGMASRILPSCPNNRYPELRVKLCGLDFPNPVGMAAGFDKNCEVPDALLKLGFGFAEAGTVTPLAQQGNPRPRIFRFAQEKAIINRLGFNNKGHDYVLERLTQRSRSANNHGILGINLGANKDSPDFVSDYELGLEKFWQLADYFTINISSPNTPGLRKLQSADALYELAKRIGDKRDELAEMADGQKNSPPLFLKIAPDLNEAQIDNIGETVVAAKIDGLVISNTTIERGLLAFPCDQTGGLSGRPLFDLSTIVLAKMRLRVGNQLPIIGVGGIDSVKSAWEKLEAGANLIQLYTGMVYQGPMIAARICRGLSDELKTSGHENIAALSGTKAQFWADKKLPATFSGEQ